MIVKERVRLQPAAPGMGGWFDWLIIGNDVSYTDPAELSVNTPEQVAARIVAAEERAGRKFTPAEIEAVHADQDISAADLARINQVIEDGRRRKEERDRLFKYAGLAAAALVATVVVVKVLK